MDEVRNEEQTSTFPHNEFSYEKGADWESVFWYTGKRTLNDPDIKIHQMPVQEAVERGILTVTCPEGILDDIKAHNALLEATRAAPMTDEEVEQIRFFTDNINKICSGGQLAFSAPIRTPEPTDEEIASWKEDYKKFCEMDVDAFYIKYGVKLLMSESEWSVGEVEEVHFDPKNRLQNDRYVDPLDWKARTAMYKKAQEEQDKWMAGYGWQRNYEETSVWQVDTNGVATEVKDTN
jgi:hypothetical protein